ncbi:flagellar hook-basal body protein [Phycisphaera mikurensis]|uniref:Putative flagellar basal-body rod protein FlgF n=1 Tax=Phycisphaera mikurensis (strain NBRC 102666 / KCTC 22515 / FYK2301M01) TaxID=1142394 RepID=I0IHT4_PHYMF|nr:flagellar hook-basal body complex protein [Phycisphaera mikurensis]MBB6441065.1 flagellar basal body rod protein FlgG [Phycisphaera mikurensis]BAM04822.1 putative flagellar basal-body rod protein FlgF [Phycisphaera mikurensis NBRC 102666]
MNYGLYLSAAGALTASHRQDVAANNLANVNTVGFKPQLAAAQARPPEAVEDLAPMRTSNQLLERLGGGTVVAASRVSLQAGPVVTTGNPLDAMLPQANAFFTVENTQTPGEPALTRDGRFLVSEAGELVNQAGARVLDDRGLPIRLPEGVPAQLEADGRVTAGGGLAGRLGVVEVAAADAAALRPIGGNRFALLGGAGTAAVAGPVLEVGATEGSASEPIRQLTSMLSAGKSASSNYRMIQNHDLLMDRAINTLARVA